MLKIWEQEDTDFFNSIDPVVYFFSRQIESFSLAILDDTAVPSPGEDGRETVKLIEGMYRSRVRGTPIRY